jgi:hypothetical protein
MPAKGSLLTFVVMSDAGTMSDRTNVSVEIPAQVVWADEEAGCFGLSFSNNV